MIVRTVATANQEAALVNTVVVMPDCPRPTVPVVVRMRKVVTRPVTREGRHLATVSSRLGRTIIVLTTNGQKGPSLRQGDPSDGGPTIVMFRVILVR